MCAPPFVTKQRPPHLENPGSATENHRKNEGLLYLAGNPHYIYQKRHEYCLLAQQKGTKGIAI